jgi:hypothetical protein
MSAVSSVAYFEYRKSLTTFDVGDGLVLVRPTAKMVTNVNYYIRPLYAQISSRIPNVFNIANPPFNNRIVHVKRNVADPWTLVTLPIGNFSVAQIASAIVSAVSAWFTNAQDPSLIMTANPVTDVITITIVGGKLSAGGTQFCLDIETGTNMYQTLGFASGSTIFTANGSYASTLTPKLDTQGTSVDVLVSLCNYKIVNGNPTKILMSIPLVLAQNTTTDFLYPPIGSPPQPMMPYTGTDVINNFVVQFRSPYGQPIYWMSGDLYIAFDIVRPMT